MVNRAGRPTCVRSGDDGDFPSTTERLRQAEQHLLEAGQLLAEMDERVELAEDISALSCRLVGV